VDAASDIPSSAVANGLPILRGLDGARRQADCRGRGRRALRSRGDVTDTGAAARGERARAGTVLLRKPNAVRGTERLWFF